MTVCFVVTIALLSYVYFGYPLLLVITSCLVRAGQKREEYRDLPFVTLVIPAYNEELVLQRKLENAIGLEYPSDRFEIFVGDDHSHDKTAEIATSFESSGVKLFSFPNRRGKASVLNDLVSAANGEFVLLCDANVMFQRDAVNRLVGSMSDDVGAVSGDVRLKSEDASFGSGESLYYWFERRLQQWESKIGSLMGVDGGMYLLRKNLFKPLPSDTILDDFVISMRVIKQGKKVVYEPSAIATENATPFATTEFRRRKRMSAGAAQSLIRGECPQPFRPIQFWQYLSHKFLRWMVPVLLLVLLTSSLFFLVEACNVQGDVYRADLRILCRCDFSGLATVSKYAIGRDYLLLCHDIRRHDLRIRCRVGSSPTGNLGENGARSR